MPRRPPSRRCVCALPSRLGWATPRRPLPPRRSRAPPKVAVFRCACPTRLARLTSARVRLLTSSTTTSSTFLRPLTRPSTASGASPPRPLCCPLAAQQRVGMRRSPRVPSGPPWTPPTPPGTFVATGHSTRRRNRYGDRRRRAPCVSISSRASRSERLGAPSPRPRARARGLLAIRAPDLLASCSARRARLAVPGACRSRNIDSRKSSPGPPDAPRRGSTRAIAPPLASRHLARPLRGLDLRGCGRRGGRKVCARRGPAGWGPAPAGVEGLARSACALARARPSTASRVSQGAFAPASCAARSRDVERRERLAFPTAKSSRSYIWKSGPRPGPDMVTWPAFLTGSRRSL